VLANRDICAHLYDKKEAFFYPADINRADYVVVTEDIKESIFKNEDFVKNYSVIYEEPKISLYKKRRKVAKT
jgi:hypothetical protein